MDGIAPKTGLICFKTNVNRNQEMEDGTIECPLVDSFVSRFSPTKNPNTKLYEINPNKLTATHFVRNKSNLNEAEARIQFKSRRTKEWLDPIDLQRRKYRNFPCALLTWYHSILDLLFPHFKVDGIQEIGYRFVDDPREVMPESCASPDPRPRFPLEDWQVEFLSIVFFIIPERKTDIYDRIKMLSDIEFRVNTQVIV
jgi:hypothetical protein